MSVASIQLCAGFFLLGAATTGLPLLLCWWLDHREQRDEIKWRRL